MVTLYYAKVSKWEFFRLWKWIEGGAVYGVMLASFYGGAIIFTIYAAIRLAHS